MKVEIEVPIYEYMGEKAVLNSRMVVESHWNQRAIVILVTPKGERMAVGADELRRAITAAEQAHR